MCKVTEVINLAYPCSENCKKFSVRRKINLVGQASRKESILKKIIIKKEKEKESIFTYEVLMRSHVTPRNVN